MPCVLNETVQITKAVTGIKIDSFSVYFADQSILIEYSELAGEEVIGEEVLLLDSIEFMEAIVETNTKAGVDVYGPLKMTLYEKILSRRMLEGVIG